MLPNRPPPDHPDLVRILWRVMYAFEAMSQRMDRQIGLDATERFVLAEVDAHPGLSAGDLADSVGIPSIVVVGLADRLVQRGLLDRDRGPGDARSLGMRALPPGSRLLRANAATVDSVVEAATLAVPPSDVDAARQLLVLLADALRAAARDPL